MDGITPEVALAAASIVIAALIYFAGVERGQRRDVKTSVAEAQRERERREHELISRIVDEYAQAFSTRADAGPHLLARIGLPQLRSDAGIRAAVAEIQRRTGHDPWEGYSESVSDVDLLWFFEAAAARNIDFTRVRVSEFVTQITSTRGGSERPGG